MEKQAPSNEGLTTQICFKFLQDKLDEMEAKQEAPRVAETKFDDKSIEFVSLNWIAGNCGVTHQTISSFLYQWEEALGLQRKILRGRKSRRLIFSRDEAAQIVKFFKEKRLN